MVCDLSKINLKQMANMIEIDLTFSMCTIIGSSLFTFMVLILMVCQIPSISY